MTELLLIRHGETDWNVQRRLQGHQDIGLNSTGMKQAQALANALRTEPLDAVICSDLLRARQTAQAIGSLQQLEPRIDVHWRERHFGGFEGQLISELEERFPTEYAAWRARQIDSQFPVGVNGSGESIRQFHERIATALLALSQRFAGKKIAVVAHGGVLECVYRIAQNLPLDAAREVSMLNASINRFSIEADPLRLTLQQWGDVRHLSTALDEIA